MSSPLSNELFFEAHRGITQSPKKNKRLGLHWTLDPKIAFNMANQWITPHKRDLGMGDEGHPTVLRAKIPLSSVETDTSELSSSGVYTDPRDFHIEKEVTVKNTAPVLVTGMTQYKPTRTRTRSYNPPREMKA